MLFNRVKTPDSIAPFSPRSIRKILVVNVDGIGDVLLATPLLHSLRKAFPSSEISYFIKSPVMERVLSGLNIVDDFFHIPTKASLLKTLNLVLTMRKRNYDLVITKTETDRIKGPLFSYLIGAKYRAGEVSQSWGELGFLYNIRVPLNMKQHQVESNADILQAVTGLRPENNLLFHITPSEVKEAEAKLKELDFGPDEKFVAIHPGCVSVEKFKRWPAKNFIKMIEYLNDEHGLRSLVLGGPDELDLISTFSESNVPHAINTLSLGATAEILKRASFFLGNNSGLSHLAAAFGTPSITIIHKYRNNRSCPFGAIKQTVVSESDPGKGAYDLATVRVEQVTKAIDGFIATNRLNRTSVNVTTDR